MNGRRAALAAFGAAAVVINGRALGLSWIVIALIFVATGVTIAAAVFVIWRMVLAKKPSLLRGDENVFLTGTLLGSVRNESGYLLVGSRGLRWVPRKGAETEWILSWEHVTGVSFARAPSRLTSYVRIGFDAGEHMFRLGAEVADFLRAAANSGIEVTHDPELRNVGRERSTRATR